MANYTFIIVAISCNIYFHNHQQPKKINIIGLVSSLAVVTTISPEERKCSFIFLSPASDDWLAGRCLPVCQLSVRSPSCALVCVCLSVCLYASLFAAVAAAAFAAYAHLASIPLRAVCTSTVDWSLLSSNLLLPPKHWKKIRVVRHLPPEGCITFLPSYSIP